MKRIVGLVIAVVLVFTLAPSMAFAQEADITIPEEQLPAESPAADAPLVPPAETPSVTEQTPAPPAETPDTTEQTPAIAEQTPVPAEEEPPTGDDVFTVQASEGGIAGFVERLYTIALSRPSEPAGKAAWISALQSGISTGADVAHGFFFSPEFLSRNLSDSAFLDVCYRTFMNRESDAGGKAAWQSVLTGGGSRAGVFYGFVNSDEFTNICASYGIARGDASKFREPRDMNINATIFVSRLYTHFLGRPFDADGLNGWTSALLSNKTGVEVASGFFYSAEASSLSTDKLINACYRAFLGREPDAAGKASWLNAVNKEGYGKDYLFYGFTMSPEFTNICATYGITHGIAPTPKAPHPSIKIVIDPGHGVGSNGMDSGNIGIGKVTEASLNKQLATKIVQQLAARGYKVYTTFPLVSGIPHLLPETPGTNVRQRADAANSIGANLFISVHHDSYTTSGPSGMIVLVDSAQDTHGAAGMYSKSNSFAHSVYNSIKELGYTTGNRRQTVVDQGTTVLRYNRAPAITLEAGFITNPDDCVRAKDATCQQNLAIKVADGVDKFVAASNL